MSRATYLNGSKWADLGPRPDLRFLYVFMAIAMVVCGGARAQSPLVPNTAPFNGGMFQSFLCTSNGTQTTCAGSGRLTCVPFTISKGTPVSLGPCEGALISIQP